MVDGRLARLEEMAELLLQVSSARLLNATAARDAVSEKLLALDLLSATSGQADLLAAQNAFLFEKWASARREELNLQRAVREAEWLAELGKTRRAFGRVQVLKALQKS